MSHLLLKEDITHYHRSLLNMVTGSSELCNLSSNSSQKPGRMEVWSKVILRTGRHTIAKAPFQTKDYQVCAAEHQAMNGD